jgi:polyhydroxyalkanoate synthase
MPALATRLGASLRDYGGDGPPVLFVPSLVNPPNILDLSQDQSLLRWLAAHGHRVLLLDWGWEVERRSALSIAGHVEEILLPLVRELEEVPALVGYCLGGTMAVAAAALLSPPGVATIAAPWHFSGYGAEARSALAGLWQAAAPTAQALGVLPMEVLQSAFWSLDPERTVAKFEAFAALEPGSREAVRFVALEDWANDGPPLSFAAAREFFGGLLAEDLSGTGRWSVAGVRVDPAALPCPLLNLVSSTDRIVPEASAVAAGERLTLSQGHVGMVVGRRGPELLWGPLRHWLSRLRSG